MKIYRVTDSEFKLYGRVLDMDTSEIITAARKIPMPSEGSRYEASTADFEELGTARLIQNEFLGGVPSQTGYCWGYNTMLNALEWHTSSEINIAVTDLVLILGKIYDLEDGVRYNSANTKAFLVKGGEAIEVYATTMHFCPCMTEKTGFGCVVALPKGTNTELEHTPNDKLLFRKNKWLIAHVKNKGLTNRGAVAGIYGENYDLSK